MGFVSWTKCAACETECERGAIFHEDDVPDDEKAAIQRNVDFFEIGPGQDLV